MRSTGWLLIGSMVALLGVGCGPSNNEADAGTAADTGAATDTNSGAPDANRDAFTPTGDSFANYETAITAARRQECECTWMADGYKTVQACVDDQLMTGDIIDCAREGYMAARSGSAPHYDCLTGPLAEYATCRMTAGCGDTAAMAITACVEAVNAAINSCPDLPSEASDATTACFQREVIGPASMCPETGDWNGLGTFTGDTTLAGNDSNPDASCFPDAMIPDTLEVSPDRAYRWIAPSAGTFIFDTIGTDFDTILYVRASCSGGIVVCNDDIDTMAGNTNSQVMVTATMAGQEFIVVVDGFAAQAQGAFTVNVTMGTSPDAGMSMTSDDAGMPGDAGVADDAFAG